MNQLKLIIVTSCLALTSCGGASSNAPSPTPKAALIAGTVSGFPTGFTLLLSNNGSEAISVNTNGVFTFNKKITEGSSYAVSVLGKPSWITCAVRNGSGVVPAGVESISSIDISCGSGAFNFTQFNVGVTVSGLLPGNSVAFSNNGTDILTATENGLYVFPNTYVTLAFYSGRLGGFEVAVQSPAKGQTCTLTNAMGALTDPIQNNFVNVPVTCK